MAKAYWSIKGPHFANCNCDYGCPCQFNARPTDGTCRAVTAWHIDEGHFGDVRLDGLNVVNTYAWPGAVHEGNGEMQTIIDERATAEQRKALAAVMQGEGAEPGTIMLQIYRAMCTKIHEPIVAPIGFDIDMDGRKGRLVVPGILETDLEPIKNPVTGAEHRARINLPMGKEFHIAEVARGTTRASGAVALEFESSHAHIVDNVMTSNGLAP